jgi:hypothetical protein
MRGAAWGLAKDIARRLPPVRTLLDDRRRMAEELADLRMRLAQAHANLAGAAATPVLGLYPPGHFHSPLPDWEQVRRRSAEIFRDRTELPAVDLHVAEQLALADELAKYAADQPFAAKPHGKWRYGFENSYFGGADGLVTHCLLRHWRPGRLIEVGSGFSSALILDTGDHFLDGTLRTTFIDPNPSRLRSLLRARDEARVQVIEREVQDVDPALFGELGSGDVLFIDSSHVTKVGSDVNLLFLDVVPRLAAGVYVHVHDIPWPFEYSPDWVFDGRAWNEAYLVRALLVHNPKLRIVWFDGYLRAHHAQRVGRSLPGWAQAGGTSLWLQTG